ncbi:ribonuclease H [Senna tora]|uniref:Ribonuclease H n=1 Tax=Senna tora TaxID=362788 RepID=A0A834WG22_9FABA|nr:ribonuclease H [Senna tora]
MGSQLLWGRVDVLGGVYSALRASVRDRAYEGFLRVSIVGNEIEGNGVLEMLLVNVITKGILESSLERSEIRTRVVLKDVQCSDEIHNLIMKCITLTSIKILWNGEPTEVFTPARGIRQGDLLSPYIFVLCIDVLSYIILNSIEQNQWKPLTVGRRGPKIAHLMFADDLLLFGEASSSQIKAILDCFNLFCFARP